MMVWGEAGTKDTSAKLEDRGRQCMFVGCESEHPGDCYRMQYPTTNKILITRDVIWLQRMFFQPQKNKIITAKAARRS